MLSGPHPQSGFELIAEIPDGHASHGAIRARIEPLGGVELEIAPREPMREPVKLET